MMSDSEQNQDGAAGKYHRIFRPRLRVIVAVTSSLLIACGAWIYLQRFLGPPDRRYVVPEGGHVMYVPTPQDVVDQMLELAEVSKDDLVYDLGCGDGRVLVTAATTYGCRCRGYDVDPQRVRDSLENARRHGVEQLVEVKEEDIFTLDLRGADVIFLYLLPKLNVQLIPQFQQLKPGTRIVSHLFDMHGVRPDKVLHLDSSEDGYEHAVYLWTTPLQIAEEQ